MLIFSLFTIVLAGCNFDLTGNGMVTIQFDLEGGAGEIFPMTVAKNQTVFIPEEKVHLPGSNLHFAAWTTKGDEHYYRMGDPITVTKNTTLHATYVKTSCFCDAKARTYTNSSKRCTICSGTGHLDHKMDMACSYCDGTGVIKRGDPCEACQTGGRLDVWCCAYGHVIYAVSVNELWTWCPDCVDLGRTNVMTYIVGHYTCPFCDHGYLRSEEVECGRCDGTGIINDYQKCVACHGDGYEDIVTICTSCHGLAYWEPQEYREFTLVKGADGLVYNVTGSTSGYEFKAIHIPLTKYRSGNFDFWDYLFEGSYQTSTELKLSDLFWRENGGSYHTLVMARKKGTIAGLPFAVQCSYNFDS